VDLEKSSGTTLVDKLSRKSFLDFYTFFCSLPLGFNHPKMLESGFLEKMERVSIQKIANSDMYTEEYAEFVKTFSELAGVPGFDHYFFIDGGALAVENALKAAFDWKVRKNLDRGIKDKGTKIIHFKDAFHGRSGYTLSLTNTYDPRKYKYFPKFDWPRISSPKIDFSKPLDEEEIERNNHMAIEEIKKALIENPNDIAGLIIEPIQGEGGDNHFSLSFFRLLRELADENEFLLIFDEVQAGMGITGKMWCFEHFNVAPDIFSFGKKSQVCGIQANRRLDEVESVFHVPSRINSTFGGNLADMVRCTRYLEIIQEENLLENTSHMGTYFLDELRNLQGRWEQISSLRGRGLMIAFDLPNNEDRTRFIQIVYQLGFLVLPGGSRGIRFRPPLPVSKSEIDMGLDRMEKAFSQLY